MMMILYFLPETILAGVLRNHEPRFPINIGITGYVASTGQVCALLETSVCYIGQSLNIKLKILYS